MVLLAAERLCSPSFRTSCETLGSIRCRGGGGLTLPSLFGLLIPLFVPFLRFLKTFDIFLTFPSLLVAFFFFFFL